MVKFNLRLGGIRIIVLLVAALAAASADEVSPRSTLYDIDSLIASQPHILLESAWLKWAFIILSHAGHSLANYGPECNGHRCFECSGAPRHLPEGKPMAMLGLSNPFHLLSTPYHIDLCEEVTLIRLVGMPPPFVLFRARARPPSLRIPPMLPTTPPPRTVVTRSSAARSAMLAAAATPR